jgi:hypothetical protein
LKDGVVSQSPRWPPAATPVFQLRRFWRHDLNFDHPVACKKVDAVDGPFAIVSGKVINTVLAEVLFDDCYIALLDRSGQREQAYDVGFRPTDVDSNVTVKGQNAQSRVRLGDDLRILPTFY